MASTFPHNPISSKDNQSIKYLASLSDPKARKKEKVFLIEGVKMVEDALRDKLGVKQVIASTSLTQHHGKSIIKLAESRGFHILWISERLMDVVAESKTPQPVMAVVEMREHAEEELISHTSRLIVIAHQLQNPGNLGTIIRTAEAVGASGVAVTQNSVDPHNPKAVRASMGSILRLPVVKIADVQGFLGKCKKAGFQTAAMVLHGDQDIFDADLTKPTAIIFGQEGSGLQGNFLESVDLQLTIPMVDTIDSLNVATSAAVVLYEALRQRRKR